MGSVMRILKFRPKKEGPRPTRPLQRVEIDHTKLDLLVVDMERRMPIGRPMAYLSYRRVFEVHCRHLYRVSSAILPIRHAVPQACHVTKKTYLKDQYPNIKHTWDAYGIMETVVVDNGKEFPIAKI